MVVFNSSKDDVRRDKKTSETRDEPYIVRGDEIRDHLKMFFGVKKIKDVSSGDIWDLDRLIGRIDESDIRFECYATKMGQPEPKPKYYRDIFYVDGYAIIYNYPFRNAEIIELNLNELYLIIERIKKKPFNEKLYHLVYIPDWYNIFSLYIRYQRKNIVPVMCIPECIKSIYSMYNSFESRSLIGLVYVDREGNVHICRKVLKENSKTNLKLPLYPYSYRERVN